MWDYMEGIMIPGMYWKYLVNGDVVSEYEEKFIEDMMGYRLGQPRLRQLRMTKGKVQSVQGMIHDTNDTR